MQTRGSKNLKNAQTSYVYGPFVVSRFDDSVEELLVSSLLPQDGNSHPKSGSDLALTANRATTAAAVARTTTGRSIATVLPILEPIYD